MIFDKHTNRSIQRQFCFRFVMGMVVSYCTRRNFKYSFLLILLNVIGVNVALSQCDPTEINLCEIGNNNVIQACYHAQIAKTSNGYTITGEDFAPSGLNYSTVLTNIPSPQYPMPPDVVPLWGAIGGRTQAVFLGTDGNIYAIGEEDLMIDGSHTNSTAWGVTDFELPDGVTVCEVNKWQGTAGSGGGNNNPNTTGASDGFLVFSTESGAAYITGDGASDIQAGVSNREWTQLLMPGGVSVVNFGVGYRTLLVLGSDGNLYASGPDTYFGDGTMSDVFSLTRLAEQPNVSVFGISQIEAGFNSYFVLDGDGTVHVLGENSEGALGVGTTIDQTNWDKVGGGSCTNVLSNVAYISTMSTHDNRISSSAILVNGEIRSWGSNNRQSITSGNDRLIRCPETPTGENRNAVAISNGGHISPYINTNAQICNIGHNRQGAFGDGNDEQGDYGEYLCRVIPGMPEICGTDEADLSLEKTVSDSAPSTGDDIVFTITITNNGPDDSSGSFVREVLNEAFFYINDDSGGDYNRLTGLWIVGPLAVGESTSLNITVKVIAAGVQTNYAQILVDNEVDINSIPGNSSFTENDDDFVELTVTACPMSSSEEFLCPQDSIEIDNEWIFEGGVYVETLPLAFDCDSLHITTVTFVDDPPTPIVSVDCANFQYLLSVDSGTGWTAMWDNGDDGFSTIYDSDFTEASLTLFANDDCQEVSVIDLVDLGSVEDIPFFHDTTILELTPLTLSANIDLSEWNIQWLPSSIFDCPSCLDATLITTESTQVTLQMEHASGCVFEPSFFLAVERAPIHIYAPNIFQPDADNPINAVWEVSTSENITIQETRIYDRWGSLMFVSNDPNPVWDGRINGKRAQVGVYVYIVNYTDSRGEELEATGNVTLLR